MRKYGMLLSGATLLTLGLSMTWSQQPGGGRFGGGGPGGGGANPLFLLQNKDVQKELGIDADELNAKLPEALNKALAGVLTEAQQKRFNQIVLQQKGTGAFRDAALQAALKISSEQKENIETILKDAAKERQELFAGGAGGGDFKERFSKMQEMTKETNEKVYGVLTSDQRKAYKQMLGEEFKMTQPGFGGFGNFGAGKGNFGKGRNKGKDNN